MIRRLIVMVLAAIGLWIWFRRLLAASSRRAPAPRPREGSPSSGGRMVRDRVCNTFLPRSRALTASSGAEELFFCSERCRDVYLARRAAESSTNARPDPGSA